MPNLSRAINLEILNCSYCKSLVQFWKEDNHTDLANLRRVSISGSHNLSKILNLSRALERLDCSNCERLVEIPCLNHLASLREYNLHLNGCYNLKKFPQVPSHFRSLDLPRTEIEELPDSIEHLHKLERLRLSKSKVKKVSINISKLEFLRELVLSDCPMTKFPEIPTSLITLNLSITQIEKVSLPFDPLCNLQDLNMSGSAVKNVSIKLESLRHLNLSYCPMIKLPEIPRSLTKLDLSGTQIEEVFLPFNPLCNLQDLNMRNSAVKYVWIKLESLGHLNLSYCPMIKFPQIPRSLTKLNLSGTQIEEAALSLDSLSNLKYLNISGSSIQKLQCKITLFCSREFPTVNVPSPRLRSNTLKYMNMDSCKSLNLLSELPPYLRHLNVQDCTSLEKVSFADQNLYQFDSLAGTFCMLFCNCFNLNHESIDNIEANAMLKIGSLAEKCPARYGGICEVRFGQKHLRLVTPSLICYFPGNKISANKFKCQSMNSSLSLKIAPNGGSGSRFLVFATCLVADLTHCHPFGSLTYICECQLTAAAGGNGGGGYGKFRSEIFFTEPIEPEKCIGDHVFILSSMDMVQEDKNYEEATFEFYIRNGYFDKENGPGEDYIKVKRCGVHVFYVDATEERVAGNKRSFSHDGEGDGGLKRLK